MSSDEAFGWNPCSPSTFPISDGFIPIEELWEEFEDKKPENNFENIEIENLRIDNLKKWRKYGTKELDRDGERKRVYFKCQCCKECKVVVLNESHDEFEMLCVTAYLIKK